MEKFRNYANQFGKFVKYERDCGARDIGIHLTHKLSSGKERLSTALCWFQMKGVMESTLTKTDYERLKNVPIKLKVDHLRYWFLQPMPTYLAIYIECIDQFLVANIQEYVATRWGNQILKLDQKIVSVEVRKDSCLDKQAFYLILRNCDVEEWQKALGSGKKKDIEVCHRDYDLIWQLGSAARRKVEHRIVVRDWQSKTRCEISIEERKAESDNDWECLRHHIQFMMDISQLRDSYPYFELFADENREDDDEIWWEDEECEDWGPSFTLDNGDEVKSEDAAGEYFYYEMRVKLNEIGVQMFEWLQDLQKMGIIEVNPGKRERVDIAPWHSRDI